MKAALIGGTAFVLCSLAFCFGHHHFRRPESFKPCTLGEIYWRLFVRDRPSPFRPRDFLFAFMGLAGIGAAFYPAMLVVMVYLLKAQADWARGTLFVVSAVMVVVRAAANFVAMVVTHMDFGLGFSKEFYNVNAPVFYLIPAYQIAFALLSVAIGASSVVADWAGRLLT